MKAILHTQYGPPDLLQFKEVDNPAPKDNEVLITIHATTVTTGHCNVRNFTVVPKSMLPLLVRLYACGLPLDDSAVETIVRRTDKASAAFIKELMRRAAQFYLQSGSNGRLKLEEINAALEEMLFAGGSLNAKLLGAEQVDPETIH